MLDYQSPLYLAKVQLPETINDNRNLPNLADWQILRQNANAIPGIFSESRYRSVLRTYSGED